MQTETQTWMFCCMVNGRKMLDIVEAVDEPVAKKLAAHKWGSEPIFITTSREEMGAWIRRERHA